MEKRTILIVEDDQDIHELVRYNLEKEGFKVFSSFNGEDAFSLVRQHKPDLIILDILLPDIDGLEVCHRLRYDGHTKHIPIIMLTAKGEESDILVGFQMGADDYITKPFSPRVLLARVRSLLRRLSTEKRHDVRRIGPFIVDTQRHKIVYNKKEIMLTVLEFSIFEFLFRHPGRVFSREQIMDNAWQDGKFVVDRAVDVHIRLLRKKLGKAGHFIETIRGRGYRFKDI